MPDSPPYRTDDPKAEEMRQDLLKYGYVEVEEHGALRNGARVHHCGERWWKAARDGTATVLSVFLKDPSSWTVTYGKPDVEVIVIKDKPMFEDWSPVHQWANYHCAPVEAPAESGAPLPSPTP